MMGFLQNWVTNIIVLVVLISLLEIILPSSNMKRYINMIVGLLVIIVLIDPFIGLLTSDTNIDKEVLSNIFEANEVSGNSEENMTDLQENQVIQLYKDSIKKEIFDLIYTKTEYKIANLSIDIIEDREDDKFGEIKSISLNIDNTPQSTYSDDSSIAVDVGEVKEVSVKVNKSIDTENKNTSIKYNDLKKLISDSYRIQESKIIILEN